MTGDVVKKDTATGNVRISTAEGSLTVHFSPQSLGSVRPGDSITVFLGFSKDAAGSVQLSPPGGQPLQGQRSVSGAVSEIDNETGKLTLTTSEGALDLRFPPRALSDVKQGDTLIVQMAFIPGTVIGGRTGGTQGGRQQ
jgi:hypothetical protein